MNVKINKLLLPLTLTICLILSSCASKDTGGVVPRKAPYTRFQKMSGDYIPLEAFKGKNVVLLFWGSWCRHSKSALEDLTELSTEVAHSNNVVFVATSLDNLKDEDDVRETIDKMGPSPILYSYSGNEGQDEAFVAFEGYDVPIIFLIDPSGQIIAKGRGTGFVEDYLQEQGILR